MSAGFEEGNISRRASSRYNDSQRQSERFSAFGTVAEDDDSIRTEWVWVSPVHPHEREEDISKLLVV